MEVTIPSVSPGLFRGKFALNPKNIDMRWLRKIGYLFDQWKVIRAKAVYKSSSQTGFSGKTVMFWDYNCEDMNSGMTQAELSNMAGAVTGNVFEHIQCPVDARRLIEKMYYTSENASDRLAVPCVLWVNTTCMTGSSSTPAVAGTQCGTVWLEYTIDFYHAESPAEPISGQGGFKPTVPVTASGATEQSPLGVLANLEVVAAAAADDKSAFRDPTSGIVTTLSQILNVSPYAIVGAAYILMNRATLTGMTWPCPSLRYRDLYACPRHDLDGTGEQDVMTYSLVTAASALPANVVAYGTVHAGKLVHGTVFLSGRWTPTGLGDSPDLSIVLSGTYRTCRITHIQWCDDPTWPAGVACDMLDFVDFYAINCYDDTDNFWFAPFYSGTGTFTTVGSLATQKPWITLRNEAYSYDLVPEYE